MQKMQIGVGHSTNQVGGSNQTIRSQMLLTNEMFCHSLKNYCRDGNFPDDGNIVVVPTVDLCLLSQAMSFSHKLK
jgi:formylmethanofuran:tetrahydromethanopterin formyltransferase